MKTQKTDKLKKLKVENMQLQLEIRRDIQLVDKYVLWSITMSDSAEQQKKITEANTYAERLKENVLALEKSFSDKDMTTALDAALIVDPINELQTAAQKLKCGQLDTEITYVSEDELGDLAQNFREACVKMRTVIQDVGHLLSRMAEGKFNVDTSIEQDYVGDFRLLLDSIRAMEVQLNDTLGQINNASVQIMTESGTLEVSAQSMAQGAANAVKAAASAKESAQNADRSREEINGLTEAMERITITSREIENIIAAIEDIASQTNLLSLNASIEAARAGEAGRGFAVVADQIGKLAADSAQSAINTRELIVKSLTEIENGNRIVEHTMDTIGSILESMEQFAGMASGMADSSKSQANLLREIETGVEQISAVVENNSATAQETSAISEELSSQAQDLERMVGIFELKNN